jgi:hypothetical protein
LLVKVIDGDPPNSFELTIFANTLSRKKINSSFWISLVVEVGYFPLSHALGLLRTKTLFYFCAQYYTGATPSVHKLKDFWFSSVILTSFLMFAFVGNSGNVHCGTASILITRVVVVD